MLYSSGRLYNVLRCRGNGGINCARRLSLGRFAVQRRRGTVARKRCQVDIRLSVGSYRFISGPRRRPLWQRPRRLPRSRRWARVQVGRQPLQTERCRCVICVLIRSVSVPPAGGRATRPPAGDLTRRATSARATCILQGNNVASHRKHTLYTKLQAG